MIKAAIHSTFNRLLPNGLYPALSFELRSFLGRLLTPRLSREACEGRYLNLGCGNVYIEGMVNADFFSNKRKDFGLDLRYPFEIPSNCFEGVFSDHTMEHLSYAELDNALSECHRTMKPGATIRIIVPDMGMIARKYYEADEEWFKRWRELMLGPESRAGLRPYYSKMFALNFTSNFYYHKTSWDLDVATLLLERAGFQNVKQFSYMSGTQALLFNKSSEDRRLISLYIEATKAPASEADADTNLGTHHRNQSGVTELLHRMRI